MKTFVSVIVMLALAAPMMAAEKKSTAKKPAAAEKKEGGEDKASAKSEALAKTLTPTQKSKLMDILNDGDDKAVQSLPGIGESIAAAVKKARPLKEPVDILKVEGIGDATFAKIVAHAKAGFPGPEAKEEVKKPEASKKSSKSTSKKKSE